MKDIPPPHWPDVIRCKRHQGYRLAITGHKLDLNCRAPAVYMHHGTHVPFLKAVFVNDGSPERYRYREIVHLTSPSSGSSARA